MIDSEYDVTVSFITTQTGWNDKASLTIKASEVNGLKKDSLIRFNKLATIDKELILGIIGKLNKMEESRVECKQQQIVIP